jgi:hypothetical protein
LSKENKNRQFHHLQLLILKLEVEILDESHLLTNEMIPQANPMADVCQWTWKCPQLGYIR